MLDLKNEWVHKVDTKILDRFTTGAIDSVIAHCGKNWAPTKFHEDTNGMKRCPVCFAVREPCWAA